MGAPAADTDAPRVVHSLPGRVRVHLPAWSGEERDALERRITDLGGVRRASANAHTRNVLVEFDPGEVGEHSILRALGAGGAHEGEGRLPRRETSPRAHLTSASSAVGRVPGGVIREVGRFGRRARIAVPGVDRDPRVARRAIERLSRLRGVTRVTASQLTGRVLVEFSQRQIDVEDILSQVAKLDLPELPGEGNPSHPLDPAPLIQSSARAIGSSLGLGLLAARRTLGAAGPPAGGVRGAQVAGMVGIIEGLPPIEKRFEELIGRNGAQVALGGLAIVSLTFAGNPLGLAVSGAGALRLMGAIRARRNAWRRYEERIGEAEPAHPSARVEIEPGERVPLPGTVIDGYGTAISRSGELLAAAPGERLDAGARLAGGPVDVELDGEEAFSPQPRPTPPTPTIYDRYLNLLPQASLAFAALTGLATRSVGRSLTGLLLVNPRAALIGAESADNGAAARVVRHGVTIVGSRERRPICRPDALIVESPRALTDGLAIVGARSTGDDADDEDVLRLAAGISAAAGSPWGDAFRAGPVADAVDGTFDGRVASAEVDGVRWLLVPAREQPRGMPCRLELRRTSDSGPFGMIELQVTEAAGLDQLVQTCRRHGVPIEVTGPCSAAVSMLAKRAGISMFEGDALDRIRQLQRTGAIVAVLSDTPHAAHEFAEGDLAIALSSGRSGRFAARADLLATDLTSVAAILEAGARRDAAVRDSVVASTLSNVAGAAWGLGGNPRFERGSTATYVAALGAIAAGGVRLHGGARARSVSERLSDPQPERFGRQSIDEILEEFNTSSRGLRSAEVEARREGRIEHQRRDPLLTAVLDQVRSPLTGILAGGAAVSLLLGAGGDVAMIAAVIAANVAVGAWQEREAGRAAETLEEMTARTATVVRDGSLGTVDAEELVRGDVIVLGAGDRVPADARLIEADGLEVDEASLTGESVPVSKSAEAAAPESRVVLEGSDVTVGTARAVVVAVGAQTRMGATALAIALDETSESPLGRQLSRMFRQGLPVIAGGGLLVTLSGLLWRRPLLPQLALGASIAVGAVPEGLPLLAGVTQAAVARRLASRQALVRRLAAVEALGRVDVACTDKTGTLTEGRLALSCVADAEGDSSPPDRLGEAQRRVLEAAALASPHPDAPNSDSHPTDIAVVEGAERAGATVMREAAREHEVPFEPSRGFHATRVPGRVVVKGAPEVLAERCEGDRERMLNAADELSSRGLRVLMVAEGGADASTQDPQGLTPLGYIGISDPLRRDVAAAVERCQSAGVRVTMLTGDHPATAAAIAKEAGLSAEGEALLTGEELRALDDRELDARLESAQVIARVNPLDKLRIVEALQRRGHVVAMTGDGVNDAPALRLADVGVAMGVRGTDVAREAADVVLADDRFATLVETLVEGRGFWQNIRRALGLLLGGNLGELALMVAASAGGLAAPLTTRQVLAVNFVTDVFPALAVAVQEPQHRNLAGLAREGTAALDAPLRRDIVRRGVATGLPAFGAYLGATRQGDPARARAVAFTSIVTCQLAQTFDLGRRQGQLSGEVLAAVAASGAFVAAAIAVPPFQRFLGLAVPTPAGLVMCAGATAASLAVSRGILNGNGGGR